MKWIFNKGSNVSTVKSQVPIFNDNLRNKRWLQSLFSAAQDVAIQQISFESGHKTNEILLVYCQGLCDVRRLEEVVLPRIRLLLQDNIRPKARRILDELSMPSAVSIGDFSQVADEVFQGKLLVFAYGDAYSIDISKKPNRTPDDSNMEVNLLGARDGFVENIVTNIALVRKRLNTLSLAVEKFNVGTSHKTSVCILYMKDVCHSNAIEELKNQLKQNQIEAVESGTELVEMMNSSKYTFVPKYRVTARPDFVARCLRQGRFAILVDGTPNALLAPINLVFLLTAADDMYVSFPFIVFERMLRYLAFVLTLFTPGFYVALTSLHADQVPLALLGTLVTSRTGVPIPTPIEALIILLLFEIFKEAGTHLPTPAGQTLSVVGGLIIGDAAIRAGMASPSLVVVISLSAVSMYAIINHALAGVVSILRLGVLIMSTFFGFYGFILACIFIVTYFAQVRSFGSSFLSPVSPLQWRLFFKTFISNWPSRVGKRT